jgi:hypothetical protein
MGQLPPGRPRILGFPWVFCHLSAGPVGSSQGQQGGKDLGLNRYERVPAVSTLGFLHDRGPSNRIIQDPDAPLRQRQRLLHDRHG